jgi:cytochrome c
MKKLLLSFAVVAGLASCGGGDKKETKTETPAEKPADTPAANPDYEKGLALVAKSDCLTCHKVDEKIQGPTYREVAQKYEKTDANIKMLAEKIIKGGKGNWGDVMMTPHSSLSQEDAEAMVKYIFTLKN